MIDHRCKIRENATYSIMKQLYGRSNNCQSQKRADNSKKLFVAMLCGLMLLYVNLGLPFRVRHREETYCYIHFFA